jgi:hypothetical protein
VLSLIYFLPKIYNVKKIIIIIDDDGDVDRFEKCEASEVAKATKSPKSVRPISMK